MRVLIATVTAGAGHLQAAAAMEEAWRAFRPEDAIERVDVLTFTSPLYRKSYAEGYVKFVERAPEMYGLVFRKTDNPPLLGKLTRVRRTLARLPTQKFLRHVREFSPDVVICTHFLPPEILGHIRARAKRRDFLAPVVSIVTDFEAHALWTEPGVSLYFVATEETKARMTARGVPEQQIIATGIPVSARFANYLDVAAIRKRMDLRADLPTVLVLSGGFGMGPVAEILGEINKLVKPTQVVVVCGRNEALRSKLVAMKHRHPTQVLGFANNMQELMAVAELIISKPGGLTTSEALALGKPLLILNPIPGQEAANSDFLLEHGAAAKINRVEDLPSKLDRLLGSAKLAEMADAARALGRPGAALKICREVVRLVESKPGFASAFQLSLRANSHSVLLYESLGSQSKNGAAWDVEIHGRVFSSKPHPKLEGLLLRLLGLKWDRMNEDERRLFAERAAYFLEDSAKRKPIEVNWGSTGTLKAQSRANGHFFGKFSAPHDSFAQIGADGGILEFRVAADHSGRPPFVGSAYLLPPTGLSVVSDLDDTIKATDVHDRRAMIRNTFCQPFQPVPGMAAIYQGWARETAASFHYVSASPWQLYPALHDFAQAHAFPSGTFHLRHVRLKDQSFLTLFGSPTPFKRATISQMLLRFPDRRFVLVGDTAGTDPEVYGELARRFPQVWRVFLHETRESAAKEGRLSKALRRIPPDKWRVFRDAGELPARLGDSVQSV